MKSITPELRFPLFFPPLSKVPVVHKLTDDDVADHTTLAQWIGTPIELDLTTLDPPGHNQGVARFAKADF